MPALPQKQTGTGFVNLSKYLQASQGAPLASKVAGGITGQAQDVTTGLGKANDAYQKEVQSNTFGNEDQQNQRAGILQNAQQGIAQTPSDTNNAPSQLPGITQNDIDKYKSFTSAKYNGPQDMGSQGAQYLGQAQDVKRLGQAAGTEQGRKDLLQRFVGTPQYTQGQKNLDELMLGRGPQGQLQQAQRQTLGLEQNVTKQLAYNKALADQAKAQTQQFAQQSQQMAEQPLSDIQTGINNRLTDATAKQQADYNQVLSDLRSGKLTPEESQLISPNAKSTVRTYGVDPTQFLSMGQTPNISNVATPEEQARYNALSALSGQANTYLPTTQQVGQANPAYNFDLNRFNQAVSGKQQGISGAMQQVDSQYLPQKNQLQQQISSWQNILKDAAGKPGTEFLTNQMNQKIQDAQNQINTLSQQQAKDIGKITSQPGYNTTLNIG